MAFSLDRVSGKLIDFFYNLAKLVSRACVAMLQHRASTGSEMGALSLKASSEDMHPDAVIARKYAEGDPETIRKLSIFDP